MDGAELTGKRVLITGASGFTGRHAVSYFREIGAVVAAVVRRPDVHSFGKGTQVHVCDLNDKQQVRHLIDEVQPDYVLHLAGKNSVPDSWSDPLLVLETNVMAVLYLLDALRSCPTARTVIVGSRLKYTPEPGRIPQPPHPYSLSKALEEMVSLSWMSLFGQQIMLAEPGNLIGAGPSTGICSLLARHVVACEQAGKTEAFRLSGRDNTRDFLDVRDAVRAYATLLVQGSSGTVYPVVSGVERSLGEIADLLLSMTEAEVPVRWDGASSGPDGSGKQEELSLLRKLGWQPMIPFATSLQDILSDVRAQQGRTTN
ncbi:NAD-dependent epimerase/dehydratase family protein [Paenibacillus sp. ClWae2A]|uniref:NAD-dependent epimerase/dehydratase family protein n=1 Tax=Paenibacillus sp. ClWae2A TaxID=3057177 RepID=UPI0028F53971|nr:NAD-dependent epimerase/dehydratase family protein [Paenibacillus sp. ClWae2A]MDT9720672.1 NAD-dependent epimerase/dehydratase family protein [Paenibacillus sp. ClWae2A]